MAYATSAAAELATLLPKDVWDQACAASEKVAEFAKQVTFLHAKNDDDKRTWGTW